MTEKPSLMIESDASTRGWGASCEGMQTGGPWSPEEKQWHINCLEALAAFHAVKCFVRDRKSITVLLRTDNTTAVAYVNKLGGTVSPKLNTIVRELWLWCMNWDITLVVEHLPGVLNTIADEESRVMRDQSDWMLNPMVFHKIQQEWAHWKWTCLHPGWQRSWRGSSAGDQIQKQKLWMLSTRTGAAYEGKVMPTLLGFLVGRVLNRVQKQQITLVLVAPVWKSQPWYPILLDMLVDFPVLLPHKKDLIIPTHPESVPATFPQLAAWLISGNASRTKKFLRKAQSCCLHHGDRSLQNPMTHYSESGLTGVINDTPILFQDL